MGTGSVKVKQLLVGFEMDGELEFLVVGPVSLNV